MEKKIKHFNNVSKIICTSNWMYNSAKKSYLFKDKLLTEIPLILDNEVWKPFEKEVPEVFGIDQESKVVLYGADNFLKIREKVLRYLKKQ